MTVDLRKALEAIKAPLSTSEGIPSLQNMIFLSKEDATFQQHMCPYVERKAKELIASRDGRNFFAAMMKQAEFKNVKVVNVSLVGVQIYKSFIVYTLGADIVDQTSECQIVDSKMGPAYDTPKILTARLDILHDTHNDQEFVAVADLGISSRIEPYDEREEEHLMPVGMLGGYWPILPTDIKFRKKLGNIKAGTKLTLSTEDEAYVGKSAVLPAAILHWLTSTPMPVTPDLFDLIILGEPVAEDLGDVEEGGNAQAALNTDMSLPPEVEDVEEDEGLRMDPALRAFLFGLTEKKNHKNKKGE